MGTVIGINQKRFFSLNDAKAILPIVRRVTRRANEDIRRLSAQIACIPDERRRRTVEKELHSVYQSWQRKVQKLGCHAKGMWLVDFDNGSGYFCWVYPEPDIAFFHGYGEGFRGRVKINQ